MILVETHAWQGFSAGPHDLFMYRVRAGWVSVYLDKVPVSNTLRTLREQIRKLRHELLMKK